MNSFTVYIAAGAIMVGMVHGWSSEKCRKVQDYDPVEMAAIALIWPAVFASKLFYDYELPEATCD